MSNINCVTLTGNLTRDPELRDLDSGTKVCNLRIAVNGRRRTADGWVDTVDYFNVAVFGAQGENCDTYLVKGRPIAVHGRLDWRETGKGEDRREYVKVIADQVQFLGFRPEEAEVDEAPAEDAEPVAAATESEPLAA